jgi:uncharacterized Zn finger protein (UPF0148 family)
MENVFHCEICNKDVDIIETRQHADHEERILSCDHRSNKYVRNIIEPPKQISDKISTTVTKFKQSQRVLVEEKVINGKLSLQFSAEKINVVINDSIINVRAEDDYTFTGSLSQREDIINKTRSLRYEVEKSSIDNEEKEKTLSLLQRIEYILTIKSYSDATSIFSKLKMWIMRNRWVFNVASSPFIIKIIDLIEHIMKHT